SPLRERERRRETRQQATDLAAARSTQQFIKTFAARIQDGVQERAATLGPRLQPAPAPKAPHVPQQPNPGTAPGPGNTPRST
ncbi:MAG: conjugal transfer protein TraA, partial [Streptosporangiaceae bacterium]|nr:conjugal transfer protein TraA [Streptosporangiaceae bacterium]